MTLRLPLCGRNNIQTTSADASAITNPDKATDAFYDDLDVVLSVTPQTHKLVLLGDFNARGSTDHQTWGGLTETEGIGKSNSIFPAFNLGLGPRLNKMC